ncbi:hypothetical protein N7467_001610 [Penicillium canescens]|nr:hypothetical protein N7467_001610 [Penicillium canescens]
MGVKRTLTSLQIAQFLLGLAWAHCYLFVRYKVPIEVAENTFNYDPASTSLHLPISHNHSSTGASYGKARKVATDGAITCLSDSGEVFCLTVGSIYLVPLIILFVQFFTKSYKPKKTETMPLKQQSPAAKEIHFLAPTSKNPGRGSQNSLNWKNTTYLVGVPLVALISLLWVPLRIETVCFAIGYATLRAIVITAGYHRLWAHRAYTASPLLKLIFAVIGAGAGQDPIKKWCRDHRAHHRYVDTDEDPYSVKSGFFHAHMGWLLFEKPYSPHDVSTTRHVDISDLKSDPIVEWQRRYYFPLAFLMGYIFPTVVCGLCFDDYSGGFIVAGCLGTAGELQGTFCVNSVAHWLGDQPYGIGKSPRDHPLTGLLTLGEGYHNFHHEFPIDYRNGVRWYDFDPTKWLIWTCYKIGLASNLRRFPQNEIQKGRLQRRQEKLEKECEMVDWGVPLADLPVMEWEEFQQQARTGCNIIVIRGVVHDVSSFVTEHPGGTAMITGAIGKDATKMFEGGVYGHSGAAFNLLDTMRIAVIR